MGVAAGRAVLGRGQVAERRVPMSLVLVGFEVSDHDSGFQQTGPMVAVGAFMP